MNPYETSVESSASEIQGSLFRWRTIPAVFAMLAFCIPHVFCAVRSDRKHSVPMINRRFGLCAAPLLLVDISLTLLTKCKRCQMQSHWHLVIWPQEDDELSRFVGWLTLTHTQRWHAHRKSTGAGHLYQGRFKSFPVQNDDHFLTVCRYVERNALRANLVKRAEDWRWSSLYRWHSGTAVEKEMLSAWPIRRSPSWLQHVNSPQTDAELTAIRRSVNRGTPFGNETWASTASKCLGLEITTRPQGRPKKRKNGS